MGELESEPRFGEHQNSEDFTTRVGRKIAMACHDQERFGRSMLEIGVPNISKKCGDFRWEAICIYPYPLYS